MRRLSLAKHAISAEDADVLAAPVLLPRVNLLPPEIEERRRFQQIQLGLGGGVLATVVLVALLFLLALFAVGGAQEELDTATATGAGLQAETASYSNVTAVYAQAAAAQAQLTSAMGQEVRWSRYLGDLSLTVPDRVYVKNVTFTQGAPAAGAGPAVPGLGTASFTGIGVDQTDVAGWLESLADQKGYADASFSTSSAALEDDRKVVTFTSTVSLTSDALSGRYTRPGG